MKKQNNNCPFKVAQIEIYKFDDFDIVTTSPTGSDPFEGEEELFPTSWRDYNGE